MTVLQTPHFHYYAEHLRRYIGGALFDTIMKISNMGLKNMKFNLTKGLNYKFFFFFGKMQTIPLKFRVFGFYILKFQNLNFTT